MNLPHSRPNLGKLEAEAAQQVVLGGFVGYGPRAAALENALAAACRKKFAFAVSSGFHALTLALRTLDLPVGSRVGLPALTCGSVVAALRAVGYVPLLLDIGEDLNLRAQAVEAAKVRAFVAPHAYGAPLDVQALGALALPWIEDCATSPATVAGGCPAGASGTCSIFSFGSTKYLTGGSGGMLLTDQPEVAERITDLLEADRPKPLGRWSHQAAICWPGRMSDLNAAVSFEQWGRLAEFATQRRLIADSYDAVLQAHPGLSFPLRAKGHSFYRYLVRSVGPSEPLAAALRAQGIDARTAVNPWLDEHAGVNTEFGPWPGVDRWRGHLLSMPIHPQLTGEQARAAASTLIQLLNSDV